MQRPRRTSELHDEPPARQSARKTQRSTTAPSPATARKYAPRQSRIAVPTARARSTDRAAGQSLGPPPTSVNRGGARGRSPQRTPLTGPDPPRRMLFTAEKPKGGTGGHNDKKWVQEQTQLITDYLCDVTGSGAGICGIGPEFFERSGGGLRHMSIKQFIAIINHFLGFVTRITVKNATYVEDIVSVLQKLRYPHQINKSWLKTPNTQHSYGNVIVLFDFLMDFVPWSAAELEFPLQEPHELASSAMSASPAEEQLQMQIPDTEFQAQMLRNTEAGFMLWDKQLMDDFKQLQQQSCDLLIQKCSGVAGSTALDAELAQMRATLDDLVRQRPPTPKEAEQKCRQLEKDSKHAAQQLKSQRDDFECNAEQLAQQQAKSMACAKKIARLEAEVAQTQAVVGAQLCSVAERNELIDEAAQLAKVADSQQRTVHDLQQRIYQQQVLLSRAKKQQTDQVEEFNTHMRNIVYSEMYTDSQDLQLPVQSTSENDIKRVHATLTALHEHSQIQLQKSSQELQKLERHFAKVQRKIDVAIQPKSNALSAALAAAENRLQDTESAIIQERSALDTQLQQLEAEAAQLKTQMAQIEQIIEDRQGEVQRLDQKNDKFMSDMEQEYNASASAHEDYLNAFEAVVEESKTVVQKIQLTTERNEVKIAELLQKIAANQLVYRISNAEFSTI